MPSVLSTAGVNANKFVISQSDAGAELVISAAKTNMTHDDLLAVYRQLTLPGGDKSGNDQNGPDAFSFAAFGTAGGTPFVSGETDEVFFRIQGSGGTPNLTTVSGVALTVVAHFKPAL